MKRSRISTAALLAVLLAAPRLASAQDNPPPFEWKDGDRVVLIGDTFIERDQQHGYLETLITARNPDKSITFRNLGWSADTVKGLSRSGFGKADEGFKQLKEHVLGLKPTVLIVGYGMAASFDGDEGLPAFVSGLNETLDALASTKARLILLSPIAHEDLGRPLPSPETHNRHLALYRDALRKIAEERKARFVDLYEPTLSAHDYGIDPLTYNGIHPTAYGHWYFASVIDLELRGQKGDPGWFLVLGAGGKVTKPPGVTIENFQRDDVRGLASFTLTDAILPAPLAPPGSPDAVWVGAKRELRAQELPPGRYTLRIDGQPIASEDASVYSGRVRLEKGPEFEQVEALRATINAKNELYFHRWRPQNETYLFGFRKHEQGNNAREIPLFDPLVEAKEKEIARLRKPVPHVYKLTRESEVSQ